MSNYPFYQHTSHNNTIPKSGEMNKGLLFSRFFNGYDLNWGKVSETAKTDFLKRFAGFCGNSYQLTSMGERQIDLAMSLRGGAKVFSATTTFVTGMGNGHPVENGFSWHYTLGVPYLSGSQVKGIIRSLIEEYYVGDDKQDLLHRWFGSQVKHAKIQQDLDSQQAGDLIFFDAFPIEKPILYVEIMTPHYKDWYAKGQQLRNVKTDKDIIPADWHDPNPVPFLAVKQAEFLFSFGVRQSVGENQVNTEDVWEAIEKSLAHVGAGAKTQSGFGLMKVNEKKTEDLLSKYEQTCQQKQANQEFESALAKLSTAHCEILTLGEANRWKESKDESKTSFTQLIETWLSKMEESFDQAVVKYLYEVAQIHYKEQIDKPEKIKKPKQREWVEKLLSLYTRCQ